MLISIKVSNFRSVKEEQMISFEATKDSRLDPDRLVVFSEKLKVIKTGAIVGPNGAGKSTMVRAIEAVKSIVTAGDKEANPLKSLIGNSFAYGETKGQPSEVTIDFIAEGSRFVYVIKADMHKIYLETLYQYFDNAKKMIISRIWKPEKEKYGYKYGKNFQGERRGMAARLNQNRSFLQRAAAKGCLNAKTAYNWFENTLDVKPIGFAQGSEQFLAKVLTEHPDWAQKIVDFLWSCDITDVRDIAVQDGHPLFVHTNVSQKYGAFFSGESLSLRRLSTIAASYFDAFVNPKVMIFDDYGMMLHPNVVSHVTKLFESGNKNKSSQMIVVDCNPTLLKDGLLRMDGVWLAEKTNQSSTRYFSLSDFKYSASSQRLQANYMSGMYGALPLVSDFKFNV